MSEKVKTGAAAIIDNSTFRDRAVALAKEGLRVFPLIPNGKIPAHEGWQNLATSDPVKVADLWTCDILGWDQPYNIGVATGRGLTVLDVDTKPGKRGGQSLRLLEALNEPLPETYSIQTASGGFHHYFVTKATIGNSASRIAEHLDLRGEGGLVVAEGSIIDGKPYKRIKGAPKVIAELPRFIDDLASKAPVHTSPLRGEVLVNEDTDGAIARAAAWLESAPEAIEGAGGDEATYRVAAKVMDFGISADVALDLMLDHWNDRQSPPWMPEDLKVKVENAARYRQNPVGISAPEAEFEAVDVTDRRTKPPKPKLYYEKWLDIEVGEDAPHLIKGWYDYGTMVVTYGQSGAGKTHVVLSQAFAIATGRPWGEAETRPGLVVYVAAEGGRNIRKRIVAWRKRIGDPSAPFALVPCSVDLLRPAGDTKALIELIKAVEADFGQKCVMVVVDTLFRALAGGNENAPEDMGALVKHCDRIREATGATLHLIHHSGKNVAAGARGHSSLRAATDTEIEVAEGVISATKQRDMDQPRPMTFSLERVAIGAGQASVVCAVRKETEFDTRLDEHALRMLRALKRLAMVRVGVAPVVDDAECDKALISDAMARVEIATNDWKTAFEPRQTGSAFESAFRRGYSALIQSGSVKQVDGVKGKQSLWKLIPRQTPSNPVDDGVAY